MQYELDFDIQDVIPETDLDNTAFHTGDAEIIQGVSIATAAAICIAVIIMLRM